MDERRLFRVTAVVIAFAASPFAGVASAQEIGGPVACENTVDVAALARALESRRPAAASGWEIGVRASDCMLTITDATGTWLSEIRADRDPMLVAAEASWAWLHRERGLRDAQAAARATASAMALRVSGVAAEAVPPVVAAVRNAPKTDAAPKRGRVGLGATSLNGQPVSTLSAGYALPLNRSWSAGADGWCALSPVDSQFLYVNSAEESSARPGVRVASLGGFVATAGRWSGLDFGIRSGVGLMWAHASLVSELAEVSETAWLPEASVHGRVGVRVGSAEPALEFGYRAVVGDDKVVGPSLWAFAGPTASLSLGWRVE